MQITPKNMQHIITEIYIQKTSHHPNIVKYIDGYRVDDQLWVRFETNPHVIHQQALVLIDYICICKVVLEYMGGGSLTSVLEQNILLPEPQIAYVCVEVTHYSQLNLIKPTQLIVC